MIRIPALLPLVAAATLLSGPALAQPVPPPLDLAKEPWAQAGQDVWIDVPAGRLKTRVYQSARLGDHPVLVVLIHGDIPDPQGQGLYGVAQGITRVADDVVAASVLRPGYRDPFGDVSSGRMGHAIGDNYTAEVVDAVDAAVTQLKARYHARAVLLLGHSGGAGISADLLGRHAGDVDGALLVACGCDPHEFMTRFVREHPGFPANLPNPSLLPLELAAGVPSRMHVRLVIGDKDEVVRLPASQAYAQALEARGVDVTLTIAPGYGHNDILRAPQTPAAMTDLLALEGVTVRRPSPAAAPVISSK